MFPPSLPHGVKAITPSIHASASLAIEFSSSLPHPITITSVIPLSLKSGRSGYHVEMPVKNAKTAVGLRSSSHEPTSTSYLTPSYGMTDGYVSMGGAGFIYPVTKGTECRYGEGDWIKVELDWTSRRLIFKTSNGQEAEEAWPYGNDAFLAISSEGGPVVVEISQI